MSQPAKTTGPVYFDRVPCTRCGGSGHYSFNQLDGSRCYGCSGTGVNIAPKHRKMHAEWREATKAVKEPTVGKLAVGDRVRRHNAWVEVAAIDVNRDAPSSRVRVGGEGGEWVTSSWKCVVTFTDGDTWVCTTDTLTRRFSTTEAVLALVSDKTAAHVRSRRES